MLDLVRDLKPISYVKAHASEIVEQVSKSQTPVVVTQSGKAKVVILSVEVYQKLVNTLNLARLINLAEKDIKTGRVIKFKNAKKCFEKILNRKK
jgi:prevent-host-death family protein